VIERLNKEDLMPTKKTTTESANTWIDGLNKDPKFRALIQTLLTLYLYGGLIFWGIFVFDIASLRFGMLKWFLRLEKLDYSEPLLLILLALAGGGIGGIIYGMEKLWKYSVRGEFHVLYSGDYVFRHIAAAALGAIIFALVSSGFFSLDQLALSQNTAGGSQTTTTEVASHPTETDNGNETTDDAPSGDAAAETEPESPFDKTSAYFAFGIGFLSGFGSYQVTRKLDDIVKLIFGRLTKKDLEDKEEE
jgi:hypothetical protein